MLIWIILSLIVYLLIGAGILIWVVKTDPYGAFILNYAVAFILFYPFFIILSLIKR